MDESSKALLTVSGLLFGFLFTAFWWILNRDLEIQTGKPTLQARYRNVNY
jgi:hypothetical protein